jgi:hypothetical protein
MDDHLKKGQQGMKLRTALTLLACVGAPALLANSVAAQLYSNDFDTAASPGDWSVNYGADTNVTMAGIKNEVPNFSFDYSTLGIPPAPSQTGSSTLGMQLKARLNSADPATGVSVSPTGESFTGDYRLTFDLWSNFNGAPVGSASYTDAEGLWEGGSGSTVFSNYGIMSGGGANYQSGTSTGVAEALFFSNTGDGWNGYDYRVAGPGRPGGYRGTVETLHNAAFDAGVTFADAYPADHPQGAEGETNRGVYTPSPMELADILDDEPPGVDPTDGELYRAAFPSVSAPAQAALYSSQGNMTMQGALGMAWRQVEIKKIGNIVTWSVLNSALEGGTVLLATVDLSALGDDNTGDSISPVPTGTNIMFGHADGLTGVSSAINFEILQFTLIDNVKVEAVVAPEDADFDADGDVDGADFLTWQRHVGTGGGQPQGNADGVGGIDGDDLAIWEAQHPSATVAGAPVPEPATWAMAFVAAAACLAVGASRRPVALVAVAK